MIDKFQQIYDKDPDNFRETLAGILEKAGHLKIVLITDIDDVIFPKENKVYSFVK